MDNLKQLSWKWNISDVISGYKPTPLELFIVVLNNGLF